jgi:acyl carrier protein
MTLEGGMITEGTTDIEMRIRDIWAELLPETSFGIDDDFFDLGGHSLLVVQMLVGLREIFVEDVPVEHFLERPTIRFLIEFYEGLA